MNWENSPWNPTTHDWIEDLFIADGMHHTAMVDLVRWYGGENDLLRSITLKGTGADNQNEVMIYSISVRGRTDSWSRIDYTVSTADDYARMTADDTTLLKLQAVNPESGNKYGQSIITAQEGISTARYLSITYRTSQNSGIVPFITISTDCRDYGINLPASVLYNSLMIDLLSLAGSGSEVLEEIGITMNMTTSIDGEVWLQVSDMEICTSPVYGIGNSFTGLTTRHWLTGWVYRKSHTITGSDGAGSNYQVMIKVHTMYMLAPIVKQTSEIFVSQVTMQFPSSTIGLKM